MWLGVKGEMAGARGALEQFNNTRLEAKQRNMVRLADPFKRRNVESTLTQFNFLGIAWLVYHVVNVTVLGGRVEDARWGRWHDCSFAGYRHR